MTDKFLKQTCFKPLIVLFIVIIDIILCNNRVIQMINSKAITNKLLILSLLSIALMGRTFYMSQLNLACHQFSSNRNFRCLFVRLSPEIENQRTFAIDTERITESLLGQCAFKRKSADKLTPPRPSRSHYCKQICNTMRYNGNY